jgi:hypothetical protein
MITMLTTCSSFAFGANQLASNTIAILGGASCRTIGLAGILSVYKCYAPLFERYCLAPPTTCQPAKHADRAQRSDALIDGAGCRLRAGRTNYLNQYVPRS